MMTKEERKDYRAAYRAENKDKRAAYYAENKDKEAVRMAAYYAENKDKIAAYYAENKDKIAAYYAAYIKKRIKSDAIFAMKKRIRSLISASLRNKGYTKTSRTHEILGCDYEAFAAHLESQFKDGMSWEKMGAEIHIDHIIPLASAQTEEEILRLNHFSNLQPLWAIENLKKRDALPTQGVRNRVEFHYAKSNGMKLKQQSLF